MGLFFLTMEDQAFPLNCEQYTMKKMLIDLFMQRVILRGPWEFERV